MSLIYRFRFQNTRPQRCSRLWLCLAIGLSSLIGGLGASAQAPGSAQLSAQANPLTKSIDNGRLSASIAEKLLRSLGSGDRDATDHPDSACVYQSLVLAGVYQKSSCVVQANNPPAQTPRFTHSIPRAPPIA